MKYLGKKEKEKGCSLLLFAKKEDDDEEEEEDEYIDIDEDDMKSFLEKRKKDDISSISFGIGKGRSAPSQRKAMGRSSSSSATVHVCTNCGSEFVQWLGKCPTCQQWNTIQPFQVDRSTTTSSSSSSTKKKTTKARSWLEDDTYDDAYGSVYDYDDEDYDHEERMEYRPLEPVSLEDLFERSSSNDDDDSSDRIVLKEDEEWNRVLGGGIVPGSLLLLGGEPGVGKSTLLLQVASQVVASTTQSSSVLYVSGEETLHQIASRAKRLKLLVNRKRLKLVTETNIAKIVSFIKQQQQQQQSSGFSFVVIDSIQTMYDPNTKSVPGSVTQVRDCVAALLRLAKSRNIAILCIGHVTKSGTVAGPKTVEHMVDVVLNLEHSSSSNHYPQKFKVLRAYKNRFGSTQQVGIYTTHDNDDDDTAQGKLLPCPASMLISSSSSSLKEYDVEGCVMTMLQQGIRSSFMEVQVLVLPGNGKGGKRTTVVGGIAPSRVLLLMAVLIKQLGLYPLLQSHVYVNLIGIGTAATTDEERNALDVAIMVAIVSSFTNIPIRADTCVTGQVGLLGELLLPPSSSSSSTHKNDQQYNEARQMGFSRIVTPPIQHKHKQHKHKQQQQSIRDLERIQCPTILDAIQASLTKPLPTYYQPNSHQPRIHPSIWKNKKKKKDDNENTHQLSTKKEKVIIDDDTNDDDTFIMDYQQMMDMLQEDDHYNNNEEGTENDDDLESQGNFQ